MLYLAAPAAAAAAAETIEEEAQRVAEATELEDHARFSDAADVLAPLVSTLADLKRG